MTDDTFSMANFQWLPPAGVPNHDLAIDNLSFVIDENANASLFDNLKPVIIIGPPLTDGPGALR
jgi:hypothetical protein